MKALTEREREALALLAAAHSNGVIAGRLGISTRAAERLVAEIFAKLGPLDPDDVSLRVVATRRFLEHHGDVSAAAPG
jgi:DNA-binding NarL/FixJ family response regulator